MAVDHWHMAYCCCCCLKILQYIKFSKPDLKLFIIIYFIIDKKAFQLSVSLTMSTMAFAFFYHESRLEITAASGLLSFNFAVYQICADQFIYFDNYIFLINEQISQPSLAFTMSTMLFN